MRARVALIIACLLCSVSGAGAQQLMPKPDADAWLRLIRNDKLDLILPEVMREHGIDMWIHVTRAGDPDPMQYEFGNTHGYLVFTDLGDRIERAMFGGVFYGSGAVEKIEVEASTELSRAISGYDFGNVDFAVYDEIREFVAARNPKTIAVNFSEWLAVADGISHTQYKQLERILGPDLSSRIVSAERVITDFRSRRVALEVAVQAMTLEMARQRVVELADSIVPGVTTLGDIDDGRLYYSAVSELRHPPMATAWLRDRNYVLQPGDFFAFGTGAELFDLDFASFGVDTKAHGYILREGETAVPESLQRAWDNGKRAQGIMRDNIRVGMTAGESLAAIVAAMEAAGYVYTPFTDDPFDDYRMIQEYLGDGDAPGFYMDLHAMGNNGGDLVTVGPGIAPFRRDRDHLVMHPNHIFAFEYAVHTNLPERPGFPITINFSNPQVLTPNGVEWIQDPNYGIFLIQ
jgi:hypothetical protein